jgi:hypothetical protein
MEETATRAMMSPAADFKSIQVTKTQRHFLFIAEGISRTYRNLQPARLRSLTFY